MPRRMRRSPKRESSRRTSGAAAGAETRGRLRIMRKRSIAETAAMTAKSHCQGRYAAASVPRGTPSTAAMEKPAKIHAITEGRYFLSAISGANVVDTAIIVPESTARKSRSASSDA